MVTKQKFEDLTKTVLEKLEKCETRIERVILDLTLKFSKSVQLSFYKEMNSVFSRVRNIESEMIEVAHQEMMMQEQQEKL